MATIISTSPGQVVAVDTGRSAVPFRITLPGFPQGSAIITRANITHQGNFQFLHTIQEFIYVYVFGDRIGDMQVSGYAFLQSCTGGGNGLIQAIGYYGNNRIAARGTPVRIGFGTLAGQGFLTGGQFSVVDQGEVGTLGQFLLNFKTFPEAV
jgi:hypothetical protein